MLFKKVVGIILVGMLLMLVAPGVVGAGPYDNGCDEPIGAGPGPTSTPASTPAVLTPPLPEPNVDSDWLRFRGLDRHFVRLTVGSSQVVNLDVPEELAPYSVSWMSQDTSVATVVANSPARITGAGVGETWVVAVVKTDTHTYYDAVLVEVVSPADVAAGVATTDDAVPTPPTAGGFGYLYSVIYGMLVSIVGIVVLRRISFDS